MKKIIFIVAFICLTIPVKAQGNPNTPSVDEVCKAVQGYIDQLMKSNFGGYLLNKTDSFKSGDDYVYSYSSNNPFPGSIETTIQDPFMKSDYYRYARITLAEMNSVNGKVENALYNQYQDFIFVLKDCLTPYGFVFYRHDMDDVKLYKYRTTLTFPSKTQNDNPFASLQKSNDLVVDIYIDKLDSDTDQSATNKLILMFKIG